MAFNYVTIKVLAVAFVILICMATYARARPKERVSKKVIGCDESVIELCQQCAKVTKSDIVYPMCCEKKEGADKWCAEYLRYGISD